MKNSIKTGFAAMLLLLLNSCGTVTNYDAPLEPGQTVMQTQGANQSNNNQDNIPEPGQNKMKSQNDDDVPEPGQTEMKKGDDDDDDDNNVVEPGQTEMK
ncbi:hypothetical protein PGH12_17145 [Chryseobacterium wangxinyae]|uniref:hypothetical protein n=1 Tax=Chryseobacterium sp. CY350 TaxID=2997336 RepID=UPI0022714AEA|nr:hypothetical protein [Chryseobacterium sp. CY350]MCY0978086.1 hypothetical protein [Chryseobacterium sp. CY350]WBZ95173.1 hypothetical protein PGH12_17145 [Chryseobacterium sp. CY350]